MRYQLHEASPYILNIGPSIRTLLVKPRVSEPVLCGSSAVDGFGCSIYGSVIHDGGTFRMWYQAWPQDYAVGPDAVTIGYAESDDGFSWRKPELNLVEYNNSTANNLVPLALHSPSIFIDPTAPETHRYRATGYSQPKYTLGGKRVELAEAGYYTAHSSDGLHWRFDKNYPRWPHGDVITSCWDTHHNCGYVSLKRTQRVGKLRRRLFADAVLRDGEYSDAHVSLVPDDYDDLRAKESGGVAGDYYGMGWVPSFDLTFGLLWNFRIDAPISLSSFDRYQPCGLFGQVDLSLVWRDEPQSAWRHLPGRPSILASGDPDTWYEGCLYTASHSIRVGDEERMYFTGTGVRHGEGRDTRWKRIDARFDKMRRVPFARIGVLSWTVGRLLGLHAPLYDEVELQIPDNLHGRNLVLNARAWPGGCVRAEVFDIASKQPLPGYSCNDCQPLDGDGVRLPVRWKDRSTLPTASAPLGLRLYLEHAVVYEWGEA